MVLASHRTKNANQQVRTAERTLSYFCCLTVEIITLRFCKNLHGDLVHRYKYMPGCYSKGDRVALSAPPPRISRPLYLSTLVLQTWTPSPSFPFPPRLRLSHVLHLFRRLRSIARAQATVAARPNAQLLKLPQRK